MIPVYWYSLFDSESIIEAVETAENETFRYPYLSKPTDKALELSRSRIPSMRELFGSAFNVTYEVWFDFLAKNSQGYLQCETFELWAMFDDKNPFDSHLRKCLAAFASKLTMPLNESWAELVGQANAYDGKRIEIAGSFSLCGYSWEQPVPWEE